MATYTFFKGMKAPFPIWSASFLIGKTSKINQIDFSYNIDSSFLLSEEEVVLMGDQKKEWLKIVGITWYKGFLGWILNKNNRNAVLLAFRHYKPEEKVIEVTPYVNNNFDWSNGDIGTILPGVDYRARIERTSKNQYEVSMETLSGWIHQTFNVQENKRTEVLPPWHGGRVSAQRKKTMKMSFDLN